MSFASPPHPPAPYLPSFLSRIRFSIATFQFFFACRFSSNLYPKVSRQGALWHALIAELIYLYGAPTPYYKRRLTRPILLFFVVAVSGVNVVYWTTLRRAHMCFGSRMAYPTPFLTTVACLGPGDVIRFAFTSIWCSSFP